MSLQSNARSGMMILINGDHHVQYLTIYYKGQPSSSYAIVDDEDFNELRTAIWHWSTGGYVASGKFGLLHRYLTKCPQGMVVDHINHKTLDNRKANLRVCTTQQNIWNHPPRRFKFGYKGIRPARDGSGRWQAYITVSGRTTN